jgi:hypothetical protein
MYRKNIPEKCTGKIFQKVIPENVPEKSTETYLLSYHEDRILSDSTLGLSSQTLPTWPPTGLFLPLAFFVQLGADWWSSRHSSSLAEARLVVLLPLQLLR